MNPQSTENTREVDSFEDYTIYTLECSLPALLRMIECSKRVALAWPAPMALAETAGLCQEVAMLACYQNSLDDTLGTIEGEVGELFENSRDKLRQVMDGMQDLLTMHDTDNAKLLFAVDLPNALNGFAEAIPLIGQYIRDTYPRFTIGDDGGQGDAKS